ncbi:sigma-70 family RNA polymerase sigma factor [Candidatus Poribacteria bacterium]|nr:sigma-70 family RNA polymerase sigma factor [Candidatus Poribacteria bacterium]
MSMDAFLVQQTLDGDDKAFGQLIQEYQASVYKICLAIVKNPQDAEELVQDVFVCAYQKLVQLKEPEKFQQWIKKIAQNLSKSRRRCLKQESVSLTQIQDELASMPSLEDLILRQELIDAVMAAIESLPQKDRQVIKAYIDGLDHKTISIQTGLSYRASINRLYRIRKEITQKVKHLLSGIGILFNTLPLKKCLEGGIVAMKIKASVKIGAIAIGTMAIILAGSIGIKSILAPNEKGVADSHKSAVRVQPQTTKETSPPVAIKKPASASTQLPATNNVSQKQMQRVETSEAMNVPASETPLKLETADEESHGEESQGKSGESEIEQEETLMEEYLRLRPKIDAECDEYTKPIDAELQIIKHELEDLSQKELTLYWQSINNASEDRQEAIKKELEKVQADSKELRIRRNEMHTLIAHVGGKVIHKYFTPEEYHEVNRQMGAAGKLFLIPPPEGEELKEIREAVRRLRERGIDDLDEPTPPTPQWSVVKYLRKQ